LNGSLLRFAESDHGTSGVFVLDAFSCMTMELPWRDNAPNLSCIPDGQYECVVRHSPRFGDVYHVTNVEGRSWILFHNGNWAGDRIRGLRTNSNGCILVGKNHAYISGQRGVILSKLTLAALMEFSKGHAFPLMIKSVYGRS